jgi:prevent-host-death family protein
MEARKRLGELLESVYYRGDEVVIERAGKVMGVVIPARRYEAWERRRERLFDFIERTQQANRGVPEDELEAAVTDAVKEARELMRRGDA